MTVFDTALRALRVFGPERQIRKAAEEMAECSAALIRYLDDPERASHAAEEVADVEIMIFQMREVLGHSEVNRWVRDKIQRLDRRLDEAEVIRL